MSQQTLVATKYPLDAHFPIDFSGADPNGHPAIYFVKKEDAGSSKYRTHLFIRNESDKRVVLAPKAKSADSYHFQLRFRPGMINGRMVRKMLPLFNELQSQMGLGWEWHDLTTRILSDGVIAVNFTYTGYTGEGEPDITVSYVWPPDGVINIQLRPVHDAPLSGGFFIKMELDYGLIFDDDSGIQHRHLNLAVVDLSGKTFFPIKADVVGSNTILNDGAALNQRKIHLWNTLAHSSVPIRSHGRDHESGTMITLAMRCHSGQDNNGMDRHPTVMGTRSQVAGTNLRILGIEARSNRIVEWNEPKRHEDIPGWVSWEINAPLTNSTYYIDHDLPDQANSAILNSLEIEISNLISSAPDGISNIYIHFHHVPGYADHTLIVPLEKTPVVLREQNVGVGVLPAEGRDGKLSVKGDTTLQSNLVVNGNGTVQADLTAGGNIKSSGRIKDKTGYLMPVGSIIAYGGSNPPEGWLLCDGKPISVQEQPSFKGVDQGADLRAVVGSNTPDLRSRFVVGAGSGNIPGGLTPYAVKAHAGNEKITLEKKHLPSHEHTGSITDNHYHQYSNSGASGATTTNVVASASGRFVTSSGVTSDDKGNVQTSFESVVKSISAGTATSNNTTTHSQTHHFTTSSVGDNEAIENRPPYYALTYIIKY